jgi:hypothetical protein
MAIPIEELGWKSFGRRLLYKFSGMRVISFVISGSGIIGLLMLAYLFKGAVSDALLLKAMEAIRDLAIGLFIAKTAQNVVGIWKGEKPDESNGGNNGGSK